MDTIFFVHTGCVPVVCGFMAAVSCSMCGNADGGIGNRHAARYTHGDGPDKNG